MIVKKGATSINGSVACRQPPGYSLLTVDRLLI